MTARYQRLEPLHGVRERWVGPHSRVTAWGSALVIFGALALEVQQPDIGIKLGNLIFMLACARVIILRCLLPPRTAAEVSSPSEYDLLIAFSLLWGAYSIVHSSSPKNSFVHTIFAGALWITILCVKSGRLDLTLRLIFWCGVAVASVALAFQGNCRWGGPSSLFLKRGTRTARLLRASAEVGNADRDRSRDRVHRLLQQGTEELDGEVSPILFGVAVIVVLVAFYKSHARSPLGALVVTLACCGSFAPRRAVRLATRAAIVPEYVVCCDHTKMKFSAMVFHLRKAISR